MKKLWISALIFSLLLSCCLSSVPVSADSTIWYDSNYLYRNVYTVDSSLVDDALIDFPVLVYLNSSYLNWSLVNDDLSDLLFVSSSNVALSFEIDNYVVNDEAWLWVKLPSVSAVVDTKFFMYFGYPAASSSENPEDVWDSDFVMVQHMNDATTSTILDSTSNDNDGIKISADNPVETDGKIGYGQTSGLDDKITVANFGYNTDKLTLECWMYPINVGGDGRYQHILDTSFNAAGSVVFFCDPNPNPTDFYFYVRNDASTFANKKASVLANDTWFHMVGVLDGTNLILYVNGEALAPVACSGNFTQPDALTLCSNPALSTEFEGVLDEVRFSAGVARSSAWVGASYESQTLNLVSLIEVDDLSSFFEVASRGEIIGAAVVASLILIPLLIFILFAFFKRRR